MTTRWQVRHSEDFDRELRSHVDRYTGKYSSERALELNGPKDDSEFVAYRDFCAKVRDILQRKIDPATLASTHYQMDSGVEIRTLRKAPWTGFYLLDRNSDPSKCIALRVFHDVDLRGKAIPEILKTTIAKIRDGKPE